MRSPSVESEVVIGASSSTRHAISPSSAAVAGVERVAPGSPCSSGQIGPAAGSSRVLVGSGSGEGSQMNWRYTHQPVIASTTRLSAAAQRSSARRRPRAARISRCLLERCSVPSRSASGATSCSGPSRVRQRWQIRVSTDIRERHFGQSR